MAKKEEDNEEKAKAAAEKKLKDEQRRREIEEILTGANARLGVYPGHGRHDELNYEVGL
jgi:hypothetical protein